MKAFTLSLIMSWPFFGLDIMQLSVNRRPLVAAGEDSLAHTHTHLKEGKVECAYWLRAARAHQC